MRYDRRTHRNIINKQINTYIKCKRYGSPTQSENPPFKERKSGTTKMLETEKCYNYQQRHHKVTGYRQEGMPSGGTLMA